MNCWSWHKRPLACLGGFPTSGRAASTSRCPNEMKECQYLSTLNFQDSRRWICPEFKKVCDARIAARPAYDRHSRKRRRARSSRASGAAAVPGSSFGSSSARSHRASAPGSLARPSRRRPRAHGLAALEPSRLSTPKLLLELGRGAQCHLHRRGLLWRSVSRERSGGARVWTGEHDRCRGRCARPLLLRIGTRLDVRARSLHAHLNH